MKMKLRAGEEIFCNFFLEDKEFMEVQKIHGFCAIGMITKWGILPYFSERNWYAGGYAQGEHVIYLQHQWLLSRAIVFELVRLKRFGRIFFYEEALEHKVH